MKTLNLTLTEKELEIILNALDNYQMKDDANYQDVDDDELKKDMDIKNNLFENLEVKEYFLKNPNPKI